MTADVAALRAAFERQYGRAASLISEAPGRVNLIGEHTDYNGGFVLPVAIDRTVAVALAGRADGIIRAYSLDFDQSDEFAAQRVRRFAGTKGGWRDYLRGVVWALQDSHVDIGGADIAITGDVPRGAGLSSSAAVEVALAGALVGRMVSPGAQQLALICQKAENMFVGVQSGVMDQLASAMGGAGQALLIDCRSLDVSSVPVPQGLAIVVIDSKVERRLADTAYNRRREECAEAARALGVESLRDATEQMLGALSGDLLRRARHVVTENTRVLQMAEVLREDAESAASEGAASGAPTERLGRLMRQSHESLRDDFEVSVAELDLLVKVAVDNGAIGARLTGAGFGGCTVNIVPMGAADGFGKAVVGEYRQRTGLDADVHRCRAVDGLRVTNV